MQTAAQLRELSRNQDLTSQLKFRVVMMGRMEDLHVDLHASDVFVDVTSVCGGAWDATFTP